MTETTLHKNLVAGVLEVLEQCFGKKVYADKVIERILKTNKNWGSRDRAFVAENAYEMVRYWRLLWWFADSEPSLKRRDLWRFFGIYWLWKGNKLPNWDVYEHFEKVHFPRLSSLELGVRESFPGWLCRQAEMELGEEWPAIAEELNVPAHLILRTNTLKTNRESLMNRLVLEGLEPEAFAYNDVGIVLKKRANTFRLDSFKEGWYEVQDGGSKLIAPYLQVEPGMRVIDACAGAGGKSLHLAAQMENKGTLLSMDIEAWKLNELKKRARRNGAHNIETRAIESSKTIKRLEASADRVLLDVPCSGTGVIKRNPDTKWKLDPSYLDRVQNMQFDIVSRYSQMTKVGGKLVYATCSIFPSENELQIERFLQTHPEFSLEDQQRIMPSGEGTDGFFMARMTRIS